LPLLTSRTQRGNVPVPVVFVLAAPVVARLINLVAGVFVIPMNACRDPPSLTLSRIISPARLSDVELPPVPILTTRAVSVASPLSACCANTN
jgi:hypothetical protein